MLSCWLPFVFKFFPVSFVTLILLWCTQSLIPSFPCHCSAAPERCTSSGVRIGVAPGTGPCSTGAWRLKKHTVWGVPSCRLLCLVLHPPLSYLVCLTSRSSTLVSSTFKADLVLHPVGSHFTTLSPLVIKWRCTVLFGFLSKISKFWNWF